MGFSRNKQSVLLQTAMLGGMLAAGAAQAQATAGADGYTFNHDLTNIPGANAWDADLPNFSFSAPGIISTGGINNSGTIVGQQQPQTGSYAGENIGFAGTAGVVYNNSSNLMVTGINNGGDIVGYDTSNNLSFYSAPANYASASPTTAISDTNSYGGKVVRTIATGVSDTGMVVGYDYGVDGNGNAFGHSFEYNVGSGVYTDLTTPTGGAFAGGSYFDATAVSSNGEYVVGDFQTAAGNQEGFIYNGATGAWSILADANAGGGLTVSGVNSSGEVVGYYADTGSGANNGYEVGFVYDAVSAAFVVDGLMDPANFDSANYNAEGSYGSGTFITGINDNGVLVGYIGGDGFAFTATPMAAAVPLPGAAWLMSGALAGMGALGRRKQRRG